VPETAFPYVAADVACNGPYPHSYWIDNWAFIGGGVGLPTVDEIKSAIMNYGPVSAGVYVNSAFQAYTGGVFNNTDNKDINHAVVLVGWDDSLGAGGAWILRNSWGSGWGESGYMRIQYGCSQVGYAANFVDYRSSIGLQGSPSTGLSAAGPRGGPFQPAATTYTLFNSATHNIDWTGTHAQPWLNVSPDSGQLAPGGQVVVTVSINQEADALPMGAYADEVVFSNLTDHVGFSRAVTLRAGQMDFFTENFDTHKNDLAWKMITFTPESSTNGYAAGCSGISAFPNDPTGGTRLTLSDDGYYNLRLTNRMSVAFFGTRYTNFYVSANGYLTFARSDTTYTATLTNHFRRVRLAALFEDLNPALGGTVTWKQLPDHVAVTYQDVPEYNTTGKNSFQIELFTNGVLRLSYLGLDTVRGLAGLSRGAGVPANFQQSDLTSYGIDETQNITVSVEAYPPEGGVVGGGGVYPLGSQCQLTATPNYGFSFSSWNDGNTQTVRTVTVPAESIIYTARFQPIMATLTVQASPTNGGSVTGGGEFQVGTRHELTASSRLGWRFTGWSDGVQAGARVVEVPLGGTNYVASFVLHTNVTVSILLQSTRGGPVGLWTLGDNYLPAAWQAVAGSLPAGWVCRAQHGEQILLQQGDGGAIGILATTNGVPSRWWPVSASIPGWIARDLDGSRVLLQAGIGGTVGFWTLDSNYRPATWKMLYGPVPGLIARALCGNRVLVQVGNGTIIGLWTLDASGNVTAWTPLPSLPPGWIARAMTADFILLQYGDGGMAGIWDLDANGQPLAWHIICGPMPGWILSGLHEQ
jgi:hypothetical protein